MSAERAGLLLCEQNAQLVSFVLERLQLRLEYGVLLFEKARPNRDLVLALLACVARLLGGHVVALASLEVLAVLLLVERRLGHARSLGGGRGRRGRGADAVAYAHAHVVRVVVAAAVVGRVESGRARRARRHQR